MGLFFFLLIILLSVTPKSVLESLAICMFLLRSNLVRWSSAFLNQLWFCTNMPLRDLFSVSVAFTFSCFCCWSWKTPKPRIEVLLDVSKLKQAVVCLKEQFRYSTSSRHVSQELYANKSAASVPKDGFKWKHNKSRYIWISWYKYCDMRHTGIQSSVCLSGSGLGLGDSMFTVTPPMWLLG